MGCRCGCMGVNAKLKLVFGEQKFSLMVTQFGEISVIIIERV